MRTKILKIALTGGGTAGHVWPNFAIIQNKNSPFFELNKKNMLQVFYIGSKLGMEKKIISDNAPNWKYIPISTGKLRRYFSIQNFFDPLKIIFGFLQVINFMLKYKPHILFSKGGYVSAPVVWGAKICRIPIIIHESDLSPALTTKLTIPLADYVIYSFPETINFIPKKYHYKCQIIGLPLRSFLFNQNKENAYNFFNLSKNKKNILIFGGSLGAEALNKKIESSLSELIKKYNIIHLTGKEKSFSPQLEHKYTDNYKQYEFLSHEMGYAYAITDIAICRAGASSMFELAAARIPMILVPLGKSQSRGDQIENAESFVRQNWAQIIEEDKITEQSLIDIIELSFTNIDILKSNMNTAPSDNATTQIANILLKHAK